MNDPLPIFAANLRRLRQERTLSQSALAERAGMDAAEIGRIELDKARSRHPRRHAPRARAWRQTGWPARRYRLAHGRTDCLGIFGSTAKVLSVSDPLVQFGRNLRRLREERGLSQGALAERAGMDAAEIRRIESARRDPGVRVVARLAHALGVTAGELLDTV